MTTAAVLLWGAVPYVALASFIIGSTWRYRYDKFGWTTRSSELYERRLLRVASPLFLFGILIVLIGHIVGLLIPQSWTAAIGLSENAYHFLAVALGTVAGACTLIGIALLIYRRRTVGPVFLATTRNDKLMYVVLTLTILLGLTATVDANEELSGAAGLAGYRTLGASFDGPVVCVATSGGFKDAGVGADDADETVTVDGSWESARPYLGVPDA
ncbi:respiratory nitrate reductase subunit gamma [Microtetraspora fusca]|uniref:respiratory nitrate reductase subunit gamma n=1 Tax=Microtetraspora fusca TaxID=1997 RepID=UPI000A063814|nr:respiratory nitrate reductase subunit gamma [Microtetraspora fusca]